MSHIKQIKPSTIKRALRLHQEWVEYNECNDPEMPEGREIVLTNEIIQKINFINCNLFVNADLQNLNASSLDFSKKKFLNLSQTNNLHYKSERFFSDNYLLNFYLFF